MGAICSSKSNTAVIRPSNRTPEIGNDQCDSSRDTTYVKPEYLYREPSRVSQEVNYTRSTPTSRNDIKTTFSTTTPTEMPSRDSSASTTSVEDTVSGKESPYLQDTLKNYRKASERFRAEIKKDDTASEFNDVHKILKNHILNTFDKFTRPGDREFMANFMANIGLVADLVNLYGYVIKDMYNAFTLSIMKEDDGDEDTERLILEDIRKILWNFSDNSLDFRVAIAETRTMFGFLANDLIVMAESEFSHITESSFPFTSAVNIIHNCARSPITRDMYHVELQPDNGDMPEETTLIKCLTPFLESQNKAVKLLTLLPLSHIVDEKENTKLLDADESIFDFLLDMIDQASKSKNRRHLGFCVEELLDSLAHLAKSDKNKTKIMEIQIAYPLIKDIISKGDTLEQTAAVRTIWELSFNKENREKFKTETEFLRTLTQLKSSEDKDLAHVSGGACFVIDTSDKEDDLNVADSMTVDSPLSVPSSETERNQTPSTQKQIQGQIMLSYNWAHKPVVLEIYQTLTQAGFNIWIDEHNMKGNLLDAMSQAIKESNIVIVCISEQYGDSQNCRTEAEFARKKKKKIIPFMMQRNLDLPGWLDMLLGNELWYKFYDVIEADTVAKKGIAINNQKLFDQRMQDIIKVLRGDMPQTMNPDNKPKDLVPVPKPRASESTTTKPKAEQPKMTHAVSGLDSWTEDDVSQWLVKCRINTYAAMRNVTCEQLKFLVKISVKAPEFFYRTLKDELGLTGLEQLMRVSDAIENLVNQPT